MAKFCTKCGKELKEGKQCNCKNNLKDKKVEKNDFDFIETIKKIIKKPVDTIKEITVSKDTSTSILWMIITAILLTFSSIIILKKTPLLITRKISCIDIFFFSGFISIMIYLVLSTITYLVLRIDNKEIKWEEAFITVSATLLPITAVSLINIIVLFISVPISLLLFEIGILTSLFIFYEKIKDLIGEDNHSLYITIEILILSMIFSVILMTVIL